MVQSDTVNYGMRIWDLYLRQKCPRAQVLHCEHYSAFGTSRTQALRHCNHAPLASRDFFWGGVMDHQVEAQALN